MIKYTLYNGARILSEDATPGELDRCEICRLLLKDSEYCRASTDGWHVWLVRTNGETIPTIVPDNHPSDQQDK